MEMIHGGDIFRNDVKLDFSVNVNPFGIPESVRKSLEKAVEQCMTYPDIRAEKLLCSVSSMLQIPKENLVFGNGASELFMALLHAVRPSKVVIPVPSFYGYEHAAKAVTKDIVYYEMKESNGFLPDEGLFSFLTEDTGLLFLANPNNPTGVLMEKAYLLRLFAHCRARDIYVVLDECFIEFCEHDASMLSEMLRFENVILIRAFTKIFAIPGVRLGYLVCSEPLLREHIVRQLPEWNLSVFAQEAGIACCEEADYRTRTAGLVRTEREYLIQELKKNHDICSRIYPGTANFILLYSNYPLYERLLKKGILIRNCENFRGLTSGYYRIAVRTREENEALLGAVGEINWND